MSSGPGRASGTTAAPSPSGMRRDASSTSTAGRSHPTSPSSRPCRVSGHTRRARWRPWRSARRSGPSTSTSDGSSAGPWPDRPMRSRPVTCRRSPTPPSRPTSPGRWTHALMDLGATVCRPRVPRCDECPLRPWCRWDGVARHADVGASYAAVRVDQPLAPRPDPRPTPRRTRRPLGRPRRPDRRARAGAGRGGRDRDGARGPDRPPSGCRRRRRIAARPLAGALSAERPGRPVLLSDHVHDPGPAP